MTAIQNFHGPRFKGICGSIKPESAEEPGDPFERPLRCRKSDTDRIMPGKDSKPFKGEAEMNTAFSGT
jgi:hypothetical protein